MSGSSGYNMFKSGFVFGQYFNWQGIRMFWTTLLFNRRAFIPHVRAHSVADIDYRKLHAAGIRYVIFDKDNTLTEPYSHAYFNERVRHAILEECKGAFGIKNIAMLSNSVGSKDDKGNHEARAVEKSMEIAVIRHALKKPAVHDDIMHHFNAREEDKIAIVGDRILSDVVLGNSLGMFTIYVDPLNVSKENKIVRCVRWFEDKALTWILPRDKEPLKHLTVKKEVLSDLVRTKSDEK